MSIQSVGNSTMSMQSVQTRESRATRGVESDRSVEVSSGVETRPENTQQSNQAEAERKVPSAAELQKALEDVAKAVAPMAQSLQFSVDDDLGRTVVKVLDTETNEVIRQIPSEEVLAISKAVDKLQGLLIKQQA
ncbi:MAG: flagellar protein FlaG [Thauera sp.]|nr:flagellar protein FlaG [Thauera sp.]